MLNDTILQKKVLREITSLGVHDCCSIFFRHKRQFAFPLHTHEELELNLVLGGAGIQRIIGDHIGHIGHAELVLVGPNLPHGWFTLDDREEDILEVTLQFRKELFTAGFLNTELLHAIRRLLDNAGRGILFTPDVAERVYERLIALEKTSGFDSFIGLLSLLHELSMARDSTLLSSVSFSREEITPESRQLEQAFEYMNRHYGNPIALTAIAKVVHMSEASFSRFMKAQTGLTFTENLVELRLGHVARMLVTTQLTIAEIAYHCGFNNMANFNKLFKRHKGCTPKEYRGNYNRQLI
ncbi:AraC-type DNA-binding protein [Chitinophaga sp. YR627]|uniref:AraC family transcriptional regulator n=1 Tax=Chitinophaga sp. YR627 TaxID=1881041 RepID=UPI0008E408F3|nr:AraC family transcriptional regulator [Chitinophaga sp. YR627]SFO91725.1 AraC-type DNA-binding protein [Chitinophaga sp. YR627]